MATAHAKNRAPSAAKRWLACPNSAFIAAMYPNEPTEASLKGDYWHQLMEDRLTFGTLPINTDPDAAEAMEVLAEYVMCRVKEMGGFPKVQMYIEQQLDIPETGEFGTADIILVSPTEMEIIDEKSGYVPVTVKANPQMGVYLLGSVAKYGERKKYTLTIHQPNYDHAEGQIRSWVVPDDYLDWMRGEIAYSMKYETEVKAGSHCKETYCPHRGTCEAFLYYVQTDLRLGWHTSEIKSITDEALATALDAADELSGWRNELRSEAMRRIMNMDRKIDGYKVVKARKQRAILKHKELVLSVLKHLGEEWAAKLFPDLSAIANVGVNITANAAKAEWPQEFLKFLGTPKHIEDVIKMYAQQMKLPRGGWQGVYANVVGPYIRETNSGLTLEKAIDGRPAHKRGSEFGALVPAPQVDQAITII